MVEHADPSPVSEHIVVFLDVLGSSDVLKNGDEDELKRYLSGLDGLYLHVKDLVPKEHSKMFSDNVLLYFEDVSSESLTHVSDVVSAIQFDMVCYHGLFLRGGMVLGTLDHVPRDPEDFIAGSAIVDAYETESKAAVYSRIVVSDDIMRRYGSDSSFRSRLKVWDRPFIDCFHQVRDEVPDPDKISLFRKALVRHVSEDSSRHRWSENTWKRIRDKDLWSLLYFNRFCDTLGKKGLHIKFREEFSENGDRIIITLTDTDGEAVQ
ncbi:MAG: hypothetical protein MJZ68_08710 [archaeon]|nr:hypothetical protein [archaeon]